MIIFGFVVSFFIGILFASIWHKIKWITTIEIAHYFDPEHPIQSTRIINDILSEMAQKRRVDLYIQYAELDSDIKEVVIDNKMHEEFLEIVDDLEQSIKKVRTGI